MRWLLRSKDPSVRYLTHTDLLDSPFDSPEVRHTKRQIAYSPKVQALLAGQRTDGGFDVHPYQKWAGAHWRLVSLVELAVPSGCKKAVKATRQVLRWLYSEKHRRSIKTINGLVRRDASQEGNALGVCSYLGMFGSPEVQGLAESLAGWQWPDGGWNCDKRPEATHSSFYESLTPLWGLLLYHNATGDREARRAADRAAEFFLRHRLFRSHRDGTIIDNDWLKLHYPLYWHYDILQALRVLSLAERLRDERASEALDVIESKRSPEGLWATEGCYWNLRRKVPVRGKGPIVSNVEVVDWGRHRPNEMITLNALRVLKASRRI